VALEFVTHSGENAYEARLGYGSDESLIFLSERAAFRRTAEQQWKWKELGVGHRESKLREASESDTTAKTVRWLLRQINFYHFHDTSRRSPLRTRPFADTSGDYLRSDGSNLPVFLLGLQESSDEGIAGRLAPHRGHLPPCCPVHREVTPIEDRQGTKLEWVDDQGALFGPAHLSDGTLRALALVAALGQPGSSLPLVSCIDEPELGLHPAALGVLLRPDLKCGARRQVIVSTQSPVLLDYFEPRDVVVAERMNSATNFRRLDEVQLASWLEEYSLSELYDKNVLGGRP